MLLTSLKPPLNGHKTVFGNLRWPSHTTLKVCRESIINISIEEATEDVTTNCELLKSTLISSQS